MKKIYFLFLLMLGCELGSAQVSLPYVYNFDASNSLTEGWQSEFENPTSFTLNVVGVVSDASGAPVYSAPHSWCFSTGLQFNGAYNQYLISPRFTNSTNDSVTVRFKYCTSVGDEQLEPFRVGYTTANTYSSTADFTWRTGIIYADSDQWQTFSVNLPADAQYMIIHYCPNDMLVGMFIDDIVITTNTVGLEHSVSVMANAGGTVSSSASVADGDDYLLTVTAAQGYYIESVLLDGVALPQAANQTTFSYTLSNVMTDHTFTVTFAEIQYSIFVSAGDHGTITPDGGVMSQVLVGWGHDTTFVFTPDAGYHVADVVVDNYWHGGSISSYTFTNVQANHSIAVYFEINDYTITATAGMGGSISPSGAVGVEGMTNQSFVITPNVGYLIDTVYVDGVSVPGFTPSGWTYTFYNVTAPHTISAVFVRQQFDVVFTFSAGGTVSVSGGDSINDHTRRVYYDDVLEFTFLPDEGYQLFDVQVNNFSVGSQTPYQLTHILQNSTVNADFAVQTYSISVVKHGLGTVDPMAAADSSYFATTTFSFTPSFCRQLDSLLLDGVPVTATNPFSINHLVGNHQLDVYFGAIYYTMTAEPATHGVLTAPQPVACSGTAVFTLKADPCYRVAHFYLDGVQHDECLITVTADSSVAIVSNCMADHTASAEFEQKSHTVNVTATGNGSISHLGSQQVLCGSSLAFTAIPDECSCISMLKIDNVDVTSSVEHHPNAQAGFGDTLLFSLDNITAGHTVQVTFSPITYLLTTQVVGNGTVSPLGETIVQCSQNQVVEITPAQCSGISSVWVDGVDVTQQLVYSNNVATYTFSNMRANHLLQADFEELTFTMSLLSNAHGSVIPSGDSVVGCGDAMQMTIVPDACYYADTVWIDGVVSTHLMQHRANVSHQTGDTLLYTFNDIAGNHIVNAHFTPITYPITTNAGGHGQITGTVVSGTANCGDALSFNIIPDDCYQISRIIYNGEELHNYQVDENGVCIFNIASLNTFVELTAYFEMLTYQIIETVPQHGTLFYPVGNINCGTNARVFFVADACYHLDSAFVDGTWYLPSQLLMQMGLYYFDILNVHDYPQVTAHFSVDSIHFAATGPVSVTDTMLACGQTFACYSVIPDCQQFDSVRVNGVAMTEGDFREWGSTAWNGDTLFFEFPALTADCNFAVFCSNRTYQISAACVGGGSVSWPSSQMVECGDSIAIAIHPNDCYALTHVSNDDAAYEMGNDTLLIISDVRANYSLEFQFERISYEVTLLSNEWGSIDGTSSLLECGANYEYQFLPVACGHLDSVWLNGQCVNNQLYTMEQGFGLTVENIRENIIVDAHFAQNTYQVEVLNTEHASLNVPAVSMVPCDSAYQLHIEVDDCYYLSDLLVNGDSKMNNITSTVNGYDFTIPSVRADQVIELVYGMDVYTIRRQVVEGANVLEDEFSEVPCGSDTLLSALWSDDCYSVTNVRYNGQDTAVLDAYSFENIHHFIFLQIRIQKNEYHIDVQPVAHCVIDAGNSATEFECGENVTYTITPEEGYYVQRIIVDGVSYPADNQYEFANIHANHTLTAVVENYTYRLSCRIAGGEGDAVPNDAMLPYGTDTIMHFIPATCQHVDSVWVNGNYVGNEESYPFHLTEDVMVEVKFATNVHQIDVLCAANGSVSCPANNSVTCGENFIVNITPEECYEITSVIIDQVEHYNDLVFEGNHAKLTLANVVDNHVIKVNFARIEYQITASCNAGGTVSPSPTTCYCSESVTLNILPEECYHIDSVFANEEYVGRPTTYRFDNVRDNNNLRVVFAIDTFYVAAIQCSGGTITPADTTWMTCGDDITYTLSPDLGYYVSSLRIDGETMPAVNSYTFVDVDGNHTIEPVFTRYIYNIVVNVGAGGSVTPSQNVWVFWGEQQSFDIVADDCYHIDSVFIDGVYYGNIAQYTFNHVTAPHEITVVFAQDVETLTVMANEGGTVEPSGTIELPCGGSQTIAFHPDDCHYLSSVVVNGTEMDLHGNLFCSLGDIVENQIVEVEFAPYAKNVTANVVGVGGSIFPDGDSTVMCGDDIVYVIRPDACYQIDSVWVNGVVRNDISSFEEPYTFANIRGDSTLEVSFRLQQDTIAVTANAHGTVTHLGENILECGSDFSITITPDDCYSVGAVRIDGIIINSSLQTVGDSRVLVLNDVDENHDITVNFNQLEYLLTARTGPGGTISPMGAFPACGSSMTFTVEPIDCYVVDSVFVNGVHLPNSELSFVGDVATFEVTDIREDINIYVKFRGLHYQLNLTNNGDGEVTLSQGGVDCDGALTFSILPSSCERISEVLLNGVDITSSLSYHQNGVSWLPDTAVYTIASVLADQDLVVNYQPVADKQITISYYDGSTLMANDVWNVSCGSDTLVTMSYPCYSIENVVVNGDPVEFVNVGDAAATYQLRNILLDYAVDVAFSLNRYTVTATAGAGGSINPAGNTEVLCGDNWNCTIVPDEGYYIDYLTIDGEQQAAQNSWTFIDVHTNHTITATFAQYSYNVTSIAGEGGSVTPAGTTNVTYGDSLVVTITPDECYHTDSVFVDGVYSGSISAHTFSNITADHTLSATFVRDSYTITATAGVGGSISPDGIAEVLCGDNWSCTITPIEGYYIDYLTVDGEPQSAQGSWSFTNIQSDHTIMATFAQYSYIVTTTAGTGGSVTPVGTTNATYGESLTVTITPDECHHTDSVFVDGVYSGNISEYTFSGITADHTLSATFTRDSYTITATAGAGGSITSAGTTEVLCGDNWSCTITPNEGYYIDYLTVDGEQLPAQYFWTFTDVQASHTITATFAQYGYTITATAGEGGSVTPAGTTNVTYGESLTVTIVPDDCFAITSVMIDGEETEYLNISYTFDNVVENHTIDVAFEPIEFSISSVVYLDGEEVLADLSSAFCGEMAEVELPLFECFHMDSLRVNGEWVEPVEIYVIDTVRMDYMVEAFISDDIFSVESFVQDHGTISPTDTMVFCTSDVPVTIIPNDCYHIDSVFIDGVYTGAISSYLFSNINGNHTISATFARDSYTVTAMTGAGGSISPHGISEVPCGDNWSCTITPDEGYYIDYLTVDGEQQPAQNSWSFTDIHTNHTITATFAQYSYTVTTTAGTGGSVAPVGTTNVTYGESLTVTITPDECYHTDSVFVDGVYSGSIAEYTFSGITADHTLSAIFMRDSYTVTATAGAGGSISPDGTSEVLCGDNWSCTITPDEGYYIDYLIVDGEQQPAQNSWTFTDVQANHTITAAFAQYGYTVTTTAGTGGSVTPAGTTNVTYGESLTVTITPDECYHTDSVFVDGVYSGSIAEYTFSGITADHTLSATFVRDSYTITATAGAGGSISPNGTSEVLCGNNWSCTITPNEGYYIDYLTVDGEQQPAQGSWSFTDIQADHTITATFAQYGYTVTTTAGTGGSVTPAGTTNVTYGESLTVTITPDECYHTDSVFVDGVYSGNISEYTFSGITADHTLSATFTRDSYTITATAGAGGSISPNGTSEVLCGNNWSCTITPDEGYFIDYLIVDGEQQPAQNSWTFTDVQANHTITATFAQYSYTVTTTAGTGGSVTPAGTTNVTYGESLMVTITPDECYHTDSVFVDGVYSGSIAEYTFSGITADHTLSATFVRDSYTITATAGAGGSITSAGITEVLCGDNWSCTITPDECYQIDSVFIDGMYSGALTDYTFSDITANHSIDVIFSAIEYNYSLSVYLDGEEVLMDEGTVACGDSTWLEVPVFDCYHIDSMMVNGEWIEPVELYTIAFMDMDYAAVAYLSADRFYVATSVQGNGTVLPSDTIWAFCEEDITLTFTPATGWYVQSLMLDGHDLGTPANNSYTLLSVTANHEVEVIFAVNQYIITSSVEPINAGQITPYGSHIYNYGDSVTYFIHPFPNYQILRVEVDGEDVGNADSYTFNFVDEHHTIVAYFETVGIGEVERRPVDIWTVGNQLNVDAEGHGQIQRVEVFDLQGRCVLRKEEPDSQLQMSLDVATGTYIVRVYLKGEVVSRKVRVMRW